MFDIVAHKYLRLPYALNVHVDQRARRSRATVVLLHGIGDSAATWDKIVSTLPDDMRIISVDLLGFGRSPAPGWLKYDIRVQARAVVTTLFGRRIRQPVIIVGHSMGSLTAIEIARRHPRLVSSLILCNPPLYSEEERRQLLPNQNKLLRRFYRLLIRNPMTVASLSAFIAKLKVLGTPFAITRDNVEVFMSALESSILDQTGLADVMKLRKPITIIHGSRDPVVVKKNLSDVVAANSMAQLQVIRAGHELGTAHISAIGTAVESMLPKRRTSKPSQK
jgi:pimeloyl-ACP methyl ester carboxylesterase